jgi:uncharacterized protein
MKITNQFSIARTPSEVWQVLTDIRKVAPCFPGAALTETSDEETFQGQVKVKLGPVAVTFAGSMTLSHRDDANKVAQATATASDKRGLGGMQAQIEFRVSPDDAGSVVDIETDVSLSGKVAQYGRGAGMIQRIANNNVNTFATNLRAMLEQPAASTTIA